MIDRIGDWMSRVFLTLWGCSHPYRERREVMGMFHYFVRTYCKTCGAVIDHYTEGKG